MKICAVIPCYKVSEKIISELGKNYNKLDMFIVIDDCCPNKIGLKLRKKFKNKKKIKIIFNKNNLGVGGSVKKGITHAINSKIDIIFKFDGDCQTKFEDIYKFKRYLLKDFEFIKGNRFVNSSRSINMPFHRNFGNRIISIIFKILSNRWDIEDPLNGYIGFNKSLLKKIKLGSIANDYFFETNLLFQIAENKIPVKHFSNFVTYRDDILSSFNPLSELFNFSSKMFEYFLRRLSRSYLNLKKFNLNSILILLITFLGSKFIYEFFLQFIGLNVPINFKSLQIALLLLPIFYFIDYLRINEKKP